MSEQQLPASGQAATDRSPNGANRAPEKSRRLEESISTLLRAGVLTAAAFLAAALPWIVFGASTQRASGPTVVEALAGLRSLDPQSLAALGVIILVATPILQLLASALLFWREHDRLYVGFTLVVCAIVATGAVLTGASG